MDADHPKPTDSPHAGQNEADGRSAGCAFHYGRADTCGVPTHQRKQGGRGPAIRDNSPGYDRGLQGRPDLEGPTQWRLER